MSKPLPSVRKVFIVTEALCLLGTVGICTAALANSNQTTENL